MGAAWGVHQIRGLGVESNDTQPRIADDSVFGAAPNGRAPDAAVLGVLEREGRGTQGIYERTIGRENAA